MAVSVIVKGKQSDPVLVKDQFEALQICRQAWGDDAFMAYFMWILAKEPDPITNSRYIPFKLNKLQTDLSNSLSNQNLLLKGRQQGGTTFFMLKRLLLPAISQYGWRGLFVSQKQAYANQHFFILDRARRTFGMVRPGAGDDVNHLADDLRKHLLKRRLANRRELLFENLDSSVFVDTAENTEAGQGFCRHPDMLVPSPNGDLYRFGDLQVGDTIVGDDGKPVRVSRTFRIPAANHSHKGQAIQLEVVGFKTMLEICAPNHPFETRRGMIEAKDIDSDDYIAFPKRKLTTTCTHMSLPDPGVRPGPSASHAGARMKLTRGVGFVCGFYLADGSAQGNRALIFPMMNPRKIAEVEPRLQKFFAHFSGMREQTKTVNLPDGTVQKKRYIIGSSTPFCAWIRENFGWAETKHIPEWWANAPQEFLIGIIEGLLMGDGDWNKKKNSVVLTSTNCRLVTVVWQMILALGWGVPGIWQQNKLDQKVEICGVLCNRKGKRYKLSLYSECYENFANAIGRPLLPIDTRQRKHTYKFENGKHFVRVRAVTKTVVPEFFDITVDNATHKYLCPIGITHNTINGFVGSEFSRWPKDPAETLANIRGSFAPGATQDLECTANGAYGPFYEFVNKALQGEGIYNLNFYEWWWTEEYKLDIDSDEKKALQKDLDDIDAKLLTEKETREKAQLEVWQREEAIARDRGKLALEQIAWRRNQVKADPKRFRENYPEDAQSAFLTEGNNYFDNEMFGRRKAELEHWKPYKIGRNAEAILFWKPRPKVEYLIGADVAEGMSANTSGTDLDYSSAWVIDLRTGEQVAQYRARVRPDQYATDLAYLGRMYNNAEIAVERNSYGTATILFLETNESYPAIYAHPHFDHIEGKVGEKLGFPTNKSTRPTALSYLLKWVDENPHMIWSYEFCKEALSFIRTPAGRPQAAPGAHDDLVAAGWVAHGARAFKLGFWVPIRDPNAQGSDD